MVGPLLLSRRQAARLLGMGRDTLRELEHAGHIRTVDVLGVPKISREECERFAREGTGPVAPPRRAAPARRGGRVAAAQAAIMAIKI